MALRLDGYVRVSRVGGRAGEGYISPSTQTASIEAYAAELGGRIVAWGTDEDYSGGTDQRPAFQRILERLAAGETDGIVVMRVDRFARSVADGTRIVRDIVGRGQVFAACHERIDPRTPEGKYMLTSFLANGELFLDQTKAGWRVAKARAVARGAHIGPTPIGYQRVPAKQERAGTLCPHPIYGPAVGELFRRAATGQYGDTALARWMTSRAPRATGAPWAPSEVRRWLRSRVYLGEVHHGSLSNTEAHEALTDEQTWARCQREKGERRRPHSAFLLSGLVRCAACRYSMGGQTHGGARGDTPVYRCTGRGCPEPSVIVAARLDRHVVGAVRSRLAGLVVEDTGAEDLVAVDQAARDAGDELQAFAADLDARRLLGEAGWRQALEVRAARRDETAGVRDRAFVAHEQAALALRADKLEGHELGDLLAAIRHVFVRRRRGAPVEARALVVWADDPCLVDVPGPHRSGRYEPVGW